MQLLLEQRGADVVVTEEVMKAAARNGQEDVLHLLKRHFSVDISVWTPIAQIYNASKTGDVGVVRELLDEGVSPNFKDDHGRTPLWWSASNGHVSVVMLLLERDDVQLNVTDSNGWTPLHEAAGNGHEPIVRLLICRDGVDTESIDGAGLTALAWAIKNGHADIAEVLKNHVGSEQKDGC